MMNRLVGDVGPIVSVSVLEVFLLSSCACSEGCWVYLFLVNQPLEEVKKEDKK